MILNQLKARLPARQGLGFNRAVGSAVPGEIAKQLLGEGVTAEGLKKLGGNLSEISGYYSFDQGGRCLFLKVIDSSFLEQQLQADKFSVFLQGCGLSTNPVVAGYPKDLGNGLSIVAHEWIDGEFLRPEAEELVCLGEQLGLLHKALATYPEAASVKRRSDQRLQALDDVAKKILEAKRYDRPVLHKLAALLAEKPEMFKGFDEHCQVLHGDLNVGNILKTGSRVVFLDFEDARQTWLPPRIDVAFALERLVLINEPDSDRAFVNACRMLEGYISTFGSSPFSKPGVFKESLEWLSARSLCMLQNFEWNGSPWPQSEWDKFSILLEHIEERADMFREIEERFLG